MPIHKMGYSRAQVDPDKAFAVQISHDESVVAGPVAYVQCALLYTSSSGERRIRHAPLVTHLFYRQSHQNHRALIPLHRGVCIRHPQLGASGGQFSGIWASHFSRRHGRQGGTEHSYNIKCPGRLSQRSCCGACDWKCVQT